MKKIILSVLAAFTVVLGVNAAGKATSDKNTKKVLFVVTSIDKMGISGEPTGYYLSEVSHPWQVVVDAGYEVDFASPQGGKAPADGVDLSDAVNKRFVEDAKYQEKINNTMKASEVNADDYAAVFYAGGMGTMWDFPHNPELTAIGEKIYSNGGIVSAVCHGPSALLDMKLPNGEYLIKGKRISAFTNAEEHLADHDGKLPFYLEDALVERGAIYNRVAPWGDVAVTDQRVVTGQNPQSAKSVGEAIVKELK